MRDRDPRPLRIPLLAALALATSVACARPSEPLAPESPSDPGPGGPTPAPGAPTLTVTDLGVLPGGTQSVAWAVNDLGDIVGLADDSSGVARPFLRLVGGAMLPLPTNGAAGEAFDVTNRRLVAGWIQGPGGRQAVLWRIYGPPKLLGTLGGPSSYAQAINERAFVVGSSSLPNGNLHAFLWDPGLGIQDLGTLGGSYSQAYDINDQGEVTGCSTVGSGEVHPFLWSAGLGMVDLGVPGQTHCGDGINNNSDIVGTWIAATDSPASYQGGAWVRHFSIRYSGRATDLNDLGWAVGYVSGRFPTTAYLRSPTGVNSLLPGLPGSLTSQAFGINRCGQVVGLVTTAAQLWRAVSWGAC